MNGGESERERGREKERQNRKQKGCMIGLGSVVSERDMKYIDAKRRR